MLLEEKRENIFCTELMDAITYCTVSKADSNWLLLKERGGTYKRAFVSPSNSLRKKNI